MKKLLSIILAILMLASLCVTAFAESSETNDGTKDTSITVNGSYKPGAVSDDVISVDVVWDEMDFTYTGPSKGTWNPDTHAYENAFSGSWAWNGANEAKTAPVIALTNHSNVSVKASLAFSTGIAGLNGTFSSNNLDIASAEETDYDNAPKAEASFSIDGTAIDADKALGTITVAVASKVTAVSTADEFLAASKEGGIVRLENDITLDYKVLEFNNTKIPLIIDLNGHTLKGSIGPIVRVYEGATLTVKNGTMQTKGVLWNDYGTVTIQNCTIMSEGDYYALQNEGKMLVKDSVIRGKYLGAYSILLKNYDGPAGKNGELTLSGNVKMEGTVQAVQFIEDPVAPTVKALQGTYNFNPTAYVDTDIYNVTNDGTIWTVTAK